MSRYEITIPYLGLCIMVTGFLSSCNNMNRGVALNDHTYLIRYISDEAAICDITREPMCVIKREFPERKKP